MNVLNFLVETFVNAFGITRPRLAQQRTVALALGGFLLLLVAAVLALAFWMLAKMQR